MNSRNPKVSVLMPLYNGAIYVSEAISSVLAQTFADFELIIVDDGSTDASRDIVESFRDDRIRFFQNSRNIGIVPTRNECCTRATGEYLAILDCDDIAAPDRLAKQVEFLDQHPDFGMVGSWIELIDAQGSPLQVMRYPAGADEIPALLLFGNYFAQSSVCVRRSALPDPPYDRDLPLSEDYDLWVKLAATTKVWNLPLVLTKYRVHGSSTTFAKAEQMEACISRIAAKQLHGMGLSPSDEEMSLHRRIGTLSVESSPVFLAAADSWLQKLLEVNRRSTRYPVPSFQKVVGERWYLVCRQASGLGIAAYLAFVRSSLFSNAKLSCWQHIKMMLRCLIRWQRQPS